MLLLAAHVRHGLIWSSLPLPRDPFVHRPDKPRIFFSHSDLKLFVSHLIHSIFISPLCLLLGMVRAQDLP